MSKPLLNLSCAVKEFCEPYFKKLEVDHLNYIHRDDTNNVTYLCSNPKWLEHYLKKSYPKIGAFEQKVNLTQYNYILWNGLEFKSETIAEKFRLKSGHWTPLSPRYRIC